MFKRIGIQHQNLYNPEHPLDLGFLAEAMLFYGEVEIIANRGVMTQLVRECGAETLCELLSQGHLKLKFEPNMPGIYSEGSGPNAPHSLLLVNPQRAALIDLLQPVLMKIVGRSGRARRLAQRLGKFVDATPVKLELLNRLREDLISPDYTSRAAKMVVERCAPGAPVPADPKFEVTFSDANNFHVASNFDYPSINNVYHRRVPPSHSTITSAEIISHILNARKILDDCAANGSEIATSEIWSEIIGLKVATALQSRIESAEEISAFQDFVFDSGRALAESINSKERKFDELIPVLESARRFRKWLQEGEFSDGLVKEYFREATASSWVDKLPVKSVRWAIFASAGLGLDALGAGGLGTAGATLLSIADTFFVDKILKGWKPNHFVERSLELFVRPKPTK
jgi:hypothetical protein